MEEYITPGTAGLAQRIYSNHASEERIETSNLFALMQNEVVTCGQNQY